MGCVPHYILRRLFFPLLVASWPRRTTLLLNSPALFVINTTLQPSEVGRWALEYTSFDSSFPILASTWAAPARTPPHANDSAAHACRIGWRIVGLDEHQILEVAIETTAVISFGQFVETVKRSAS